MVYISKNTRLGTFQTNMPSLPISLAGHKKLSALSTFPLCCPPKKARKNERSKKDEKEEEEEKRKVDVLCNGKSFVQLAFCFLSILLFT